MGCLRTGVNSSVTTYLIFVWTSQWHLHTRYPKWFAKYNYILAAGAFVCNWGLCTRVIVAMRSHVTASLLCTGFAEPYYAGFFVLARGLSHKSSVPTRCAVAVCALVVAM